MLSGEETNTNSKVFSVTRPVLDPMIYYTQGEHAKHYTIDAVFNQEEIYITTYKNKHKQILNLCVNINGDNKKISGQIQIIKQY